MKSIDSDKTIMSPFMGVKGGKSMPQKYMVITIKYRTLLFRDIKLQFGRAIAEV